MAIKFGADGTLYCNTVRYNYKQARNMIADGSYGNISGTRVWKNLTSSNVSTSPAGYKSYRAFKLCTNAEWIQQNLPNMYKSHKYYLGCMYKKNFEGNCTISIKYDAVDKHVLPTANTNNNWVKTSIVFYPEKDILSKENDIEFIMWADGQVATTSNPMYVCRAMLIDLTETFGEGNEPSKEWCDNNIREWEVYVNYGNYLSAVSPTNITSIFTTSQLGTRGNFNYLQLDSHWEPREYMYYLPGSASYVEGFLISKNGCTLNNTFQYYVYWEEYLERTDVSQSCDFYFPIVDSGIMGSVPFVNELEFNGGGGMRDWKRASAFSKRTSFTNGSYPMRFDFNNGKKTNVLRVTALNLMNVQTSLSQYNAYNGTSATLDDINKEWCDRWIDGRSSPIIHIKDPAKTSIKFNTSYDIICNDIEIRPELSKIIMDNTGTIKCKKLVRVQAY